MDSLTVGTIIWLFVLNNIFWMLLLYICIKMVSIPPEKRDAVFISENKKEPKKAAPSYNPLQGLENVNLGDVESPFKHKT